MIPRMSLWEVKQAKKLVWFRFKANYADTPKYDTCRGNKRPDQNLGI